MPDHVHEDLGLEIDCPELVELVTDYVEDAMPEEVKERFEAHLDICPGCVVYLDQMRTTVDILGKVDLEPPSQDVKEGLMQVFRNFKKQG